MKWQTKTRDEALSFAEILQPDKLRKALLTTFVLDLGWLMSHVKDSTKIVLVKSYNPQAERSGVLQTDSGNLTIVHPEFPRQRYPIMHSKVMLLFYDNYARFVASSANLIEIDWSVMQNIVFIQDVPFTPGKMQRRTEFKDSLAAALRDLSVPSQVVAQLDWMDFSKVKAHIVTSVPSSLGHGKLHAEHYGMLRLSQIVQNMQEQEQSPSNESSADPVHGDTQLCCYGSSMGNLRHAYLRDFFLCATGTKSSDLWKRDRAPLSSVCPNIKIGFHTDAQGESCIYGPAARTCIKFPKSYYLGSTTYPKDMLHKIEPKYANTLVHAKVMVARKGERQDRGWMYLGSHNFTAGAWGRLNKSGGISINNYEFGVVLPDAHFETKFGRDSVTWNGASVPMPFKLEWEPFGPGDIPCLSE
ncbi:phospholipase D/nuclease [Martensiomyces pterosporus]|nr:phospholipase D/nuclease [Martensiomyces pterosporus]